MITVFVCVCHFSQDLICPSLLGLLDQVPTFPLQLVLLCLMLITVFLHFLSHPPAHCITKKFYVIYTMSFPVAGL